MDKRRGIGEAGGATPDTIGTSPRGIEALVILSARSNPDYSPVPRRSSICCTWACRAPGVRGRRAAACLLPATGARRRAAACLPPVGWAGGKLPRYLMNNPGYEIGQPPLSV